MREKVLPSVTQHLVKEIVSPNQTIRQQVSSCVFYTYTSFKRFDLTNLLLRELILLAYHEVRGKTATPLYPSKVTTCALPHPSPLPSNSLSSQKSFWCPFILQGRNRSKNVRERKSFANLNGHEIPVSTKLTGTSLSTGPTFCFCACRDLQNNRSQYHASPQRSKCNLCHFYHFSVMKF